MSRNFLIFAIFLFASVFGGKEALPADFNPFDGSNVENPDSYGLEAARVLACHGEIRRALELYLQWEPGSPLDTEHRGFEVRLMTELGMYARADSLLALESPLADEREVFLHYLRRAKLNVLAGRYEKAYDLLGSTESSSNETFAAYRDLLVLQTCYRLGKLDLAVRVGEAALDSGLPPALSPGFEIALVDVYEERQNGEKARDLLRKTLRRTRGYEDRFRLIKRSYDLEVRLGELKAARATAAEIARSYGHHAEAEAVTADVMSWLNPNEFRNDELLAHARLLIGHSSFNKAVSLLKILDSRKLDPTKREERRLLKARYNYMTGRYEEAASLAKPHYRTPAFKRQSILILARSYRKMGDERRSARLYEYFARVLPNDAQAAEALFVASNLYDATGETEESARVLDRLRKSYPTGYYGRVAALRSAKRLLERGRYQDSLVILRNVLKRSRHTDEGAFFNLARTYGEMGDEERKQLLMNDLAGIDSYSFYIKPRVELAFSRPHTTSTGGVALEGRDGLLEFLAIASDKRTAAYRRLRTALQGPDRRGESAASEAAECIDRGRWFLDAGFRAWGEGELENARLHSLNSPAELLELGRIYDQYGMPWQSVRLYQKVKDSLRWKKRRELSAEFRYLMFPIPYPIQVLENSAHYDLPPHLVYAMIREESCFDLNAVSRAGAMGLMQLMPATGKYVARELELPEWGDDFLFEPEINLAFGVWYASSLMDVSRDDLLRMLAAYNAGPGNAKRWFEKRSDGPSVVDIVDDIDFKETRSYVQRVVESANVYHSLYFAPGVFGPGSGR